MRRVNRSRASLEAELNEGISDIQSNINWLKLLSKQSAERAKELAPKIEALEKQLAEQDKAAQQGMTARRDAILAAFANDVPMTDEESASLYWELVELQEKINEEGEVDDQAEATLRTERGEAW